MDEKKLCFFRKQWKPVERVCWLEPASLLATDWFPVRLAQSNSSKEPIYSLKLVESERTVGAQT